MIWTGAPPLGVATSEGCGLSDLAGTICAGNGPSGPFLEVVPIDKIGTAASPSLSISESLGEGASVLGIFNLSEICDDCFETGCFSRLKEIGDGDRQKYSDDQDDDHDFD